MKILHVGDMAGSGAITANICNKLGHPSIVVQDKNIETFEHGTYYGNTVYFNGDDDLITAVQECVKDGYEHIIYHDRFNVAFALDGLHIPSSYMFHGNMLRQNPKAYDNVMELESVDNVFVSTADLLPLAPEGILFHRPVDLDMFHAINVRKRKQGLCLTQERYFPEIRKIARDTRMGVFICDRVKNRIEYKQMPEILNSFESYMDIKFQPTHPPTMINELSQTGLQALACGIPVWSFGKWYNRFPEENSDEYSARELLKVIQE